MWPMFRLKFARKYDETTAADEALAAARDAAVRDAQSPAEATAVAIRYPGHAGLPDWRPFEPNARETMLLGPECRLAPDPFGAERAAWDDVME